MLVVHCKKKRALVESGADRFEHDYSSVVLFQLSVLLGLMVCYSSDMKCTR